MWNNLLDKPYIIDNFGLLVEKSECLGWTTSNIDVISK